MIGVVRKDRCRTEQLLCNHRAHEQVGPSCSAEGKQQIGGASVLLFMAVGCADQEARLPLPIVTPGLQLLRKVGRRQGLSTLIERNDDAIRWTCRLVAALIRQLRY